MNKTYTEKNKIQSTIFMGMKIDMITKKLTTTYINLETEC